MQTLRERSYITREGISLLGISDATESICIRTMGIKIDFDKLIEEKPFPLIAHWRQVHFVVVYDIKNHSSLQGLSPKQSLNYTKQ